MSTVARIQQQSDMLNHGLIGYDSKETKSMLEIKALRIVQN